VMFEGQLPRYGTEKIADFEYYDFREESTLDTRVKDDGTFCAVSVEEMVQAAAAADTGLCVTEADVTAGKTDITGSDQPAAKPAGGILQAKFVKGGMTFYALANNRPEERSLVVNDDAGNAFEVWDPADGSVSAAGAGGEVTISAYRMIFILPVSMPASKRAGHEKPGTIRYRQTGMRRT